ncbi:MAG: Rieske (2Fe-2S) protein [Anaerolineae bacterium]
MNWIKVLPQSELPEGSWHKAEVGGRSIALVNHRGQIYAMSPACPHMGGPIYKGEITANGTIICPWHHGEFDLRTGEVKAWAPRLGGVLKIVRSPTPLPVFPTRVEEDDILVGLED